jgi:hypothetical protein
MTRSGERRREALADYLSDSDVQQAGFDYVKGLLTGGITSGYAALHATARGDWEEVAYWIKVEAAVLGTQWATLQVLNYIQGPKYAMSFHQAHASMGPARGIMLRAAAPVLWPLAVHYGLKLWLGEGDYSGAIHGYDVTREQRIEQYS